MKTWQKVGLGCGGLGCLGIIGIVVLVLLIPSEFIQDMERRGREHREKEEPARKSEVTELPLMTENGQPMSLTRWVFRVRFDQTDPQTGEGKIFPETEAMMAWVATHNVEGKEGKRYAMYKYRAERTDVGFAIETRTGSLPMPGQSPRPGCYRYLGILEGRTALGTLTSTMLFRMESLDHPLCSP